MSRHRVASINIRRRYLEGKRKERGEGRGKPICGGFPTAINLRKQ
jgi:hypothetical protein